MIIKMATNKTIIDVTTDDKTNQLTENMYVSQISSDTNANPSNMRSTGAIPKVKKPALNGINSDVRINNNENHESDIYNCKSEMNGCSKTNASVPQCTFKKKFYNKHVSKGFKYGYSNGIYNGSSDEQEQCFVNLLNRNEARMKLKVDAQAGSSLVEKFTSCRIQDFDAEYSSDTANDELSCSDECCIYTYKGDVADLPSSFMNLDNQDNNDGQDHSRGGSRDSSPEMDFLEMDFDPGASCDADSENSSLDSELKSEDNLLEDEEQMVSVNNETIDQKESENIELAPVEDLDENNLSQQNNILIKQPEVSNITDDVKERMEKNTEMINIIDEPWIPKSPSDRTKFSKSLREIKDHHSSCGELFSPNEIPSSSSLEFKLNTCSSLYHSTMEKQLVLHKQPSSEELAAVVDKTMIWTEEEAAQKQITQVSESACGATAVLNVLQALDRPLPDRRKLLECVQTRLRANSGTVVDYLKSRSVAGSSPEDIINGLNKLTNGQVYARFFHMYPERYINLSQWLTYWIKKGAVPIATLNLQKGLSPGTPIPDAWHHQMIFGVGPHGIYLTNPLERVEEGILWHQLSSESFILVKREDVISRWTPTTDLRELMYMNDFRWFKYNVLGQVANVIREDFRSVSGNAVSRTHLKVPTDYSSGITLAINDNNPACDQLKNCSELPLLNPLP